MEIVILVLLVVLLRLREFYFSVPVTNELVFISRSSVSTFSCTFILLNRDSGLLFKTFAALNCGRVTLLCLTEIRVDHVTCLDQWSVNRNVSLLRRCRESLVPFSLCYDTSKVPHNDCSFCIRTRVKMMWNTAEASLLMSMNCEWE